MHHVLSKLLIVMVVFAISLQVNAEDSSFVKVEYQDETLANKILISYHHAIYEVDRENQFIILKLSEREQKHLASYSVNISKARQWKTQFDQYNQQLQRKLSQDNVSSSGQLDTISGFECYATVESSYNKAQQLAEQFPQLATWIDIGDSWSKANLQTGYDLFVLKITNSAIEKEKPILFIHSSMHAREYSPAQLNLDFATWLIENYDQNAEARWLVDNREIHLMIHMNPDGRKVAEEHEMQRKNMNNQHCASSSIGVDLNRNFAFNWGYDNIGSSTDECSETYRGISPESEPETQAVSNYIRTLFPDERGELESDAAPEDKSGLHIDLHSYGQLILWPFGHTNASSPNNTGFIHLGNKLAWFNNYQPQQSIGLYPTNGTSDNVSYGELGVAAITFELGKSFFEGCTAYQHQVLPDNLSALIYAAKVSEAPYQLSRGIDISELTVNQSVEQVTVTPGAVIEVSIVASGDRTKLTNTTSGVSEFEYVVNSNFEQADNIKVIDTGLVSQGSRGASVTFELSAADLPLGKNVLTVRAKNNAEQYGTPSSVFVNISDNSSPVPSFSTSCQDLTCTFDASASTDDGEIVSYRWSVLQGQHLETEIGEGINLQHSFVIAGEYTVQLTVEDNNGLVAKTTNSVTATAIETITVTPENNTSSSGGSLAWYILSILSIAVLRPRRVQVN